MAELKLISRRDLLRGASIAGAAAFAVPGALSPDREAGVLEAAPAQAAAASREAFEHLTAAEADLLEAVVERLIPTDATGPGAKEARAAHYIDRALGGALASSRPAYASGLEALLIRRRHVRTNAGIADEIPADEVRVAAVIRIAERALMRVAQDHREEGRGAPGKSRRRPGLDVDEHRILIDRRQLRECPAARRPGVAIECGKSGRVRLA